MRGPLPWLLPAVAMLGACKDSPNPFVSNSPTATPPPGAALIVSTNLQGTAGSPSDIYSLGADGSGFTRLTSCAARSSPCTALEAAASADRSHLQVREVVSDTNGDGALTEADGVPIVYVDLTRNVEGIVIPASVFVSGLDWSADGSLLVYSGLGSAPNDEDLFRSDVNGQNVANLTATPSTRERRPRLDPAASVAVYEHYGADGKGQVWLFTDSTDQRQITPGGPGTALLPGTPYTIGSDADPAFSPDATSVVFRRLVDAGDGRGDWQVLTVPIAGGAGTPLTSGAVFRGAPDWGTLGIVFVEANAGGGLDLVLIQPDGSGRRVLMSAPAGMALSAPRFLR